MLAAAEGMETHLKQKEKGIIGNEIHSTGRKRDARVSHCWENDSQKKENKTVPFFNVTPPKAIPLGVSFRDRPQNTLRLRFY